MFYLRSTRFALITILLGVAVAVSGCGRSVSGKYVCRMAMLGTDKVEMGSIEFKSSKAYVSIMGMTQEATYDIDGDKITLHNPGTNLNGMVLTIKDENTLTGFPSGELKREPPSGS